MTDEIVCPYCDTKKWGSSGVCRAVRNWSLRRGADSNCTLQDQQDFSDFHGPIAGVTKDYGPLYGPPGLITLEVDKRLKNCCCPMVTSDAGKNREIRNISNQ